MNKSCKNKKKFQFDCKHLKFFLKVDKYGDTILLTRDFCKLIPVIDKFVLFTVKIIRFDL